MILTSSVSCHASVGGKVKSYKFVSTKWILLGITLSFFFVLFFSFFLSFLIFVVVVCIEWFCTAHFVYLVSFRCSDLACVFACLA